MNLHPIDYLIIAAFVLVTLLIGWRAGRKIKTFREYALGQAGGYGTLALTLTFLATNIGPGNLSLAQLYAKEGLVCYIAFGIGPAIGMLFMGVIFPRYISHFKGCATLGEVMGKLYGRGVRILAGVLGTLYCMLMAASGFIVFGKALSYLGFDPIEGILLGGVLLTLYTAYGGMKAVTSTDVFQFLILIVALPLLLHVAWHHLGGTENIIAKLSETVTKQTDGGLSTECYKDRLHISGPYFLKNLSYFFIWALFWTGTAAPHIFQRMLMARDKRSLRNQYLWSALMHAMLTGMFFLFGLVALVKYNKGDGGLDATKMFVIPQLIQDYSMVGLTGLWIAGVLAVIVSTVDSVLQVGGLGLYQDVWVPLVGKKKRIQGAQVGTFVVGMVALGVALFYQYYDSTASLNLWVVSFIAPTLLVPLLAGLFGLKTDVYSFCSSTLVALIAYVGAKLVFPIFTIPISIIAGALGFMMVHFHRYGGLAWAKRAESVIAEDQSSVR